MLTIKSNLDDAAKYFQSMAQNHRDVVVRRSLNKVASTAKTLAIREVKKAGGFKTQRYVREKTSLKRAGRNSPSAEISMKSGWSTIMAHNPRPRFVSGGKLVAAKPWGERQLFKRAFYVQGKSGNRLPVTRVGKGRHNYKVLYGANPARELQRDTARIPVEQHIATKLPAEVRRYSRVYHSQLKARYGL